MKKGISLIVLVITIIVLAILAGAIIISLSNTNIVAQANNAVTAADLANAKNAATLAYAAAVARGTDGKAYAADGTAIPAATGDGEVDGGYYYEALEAAGFSMTNLKVTVDANGVPTVATK